MPPRRRPTALVSPFTIGEVDPEVALVEGRGTLSKHAEVLNLSRVRISLSSRPSLKIRFEGTGRSSDYADMERAINHWAAPLITLPDQGVIGDVYEETMQIGGRFGRKPFTVSTQGELRQVRSGTARQLRSVRFHVANFPDFLGSVITDGSATWTGRLELEAAGWRIVLDARRGLAELLSEARDKAGFVISHIGMLDKGGRSFTPQEGDDVLTGLHWFLSFVRGAWSSPLLFVGQGWRRPSEWNVWTAGRTDRASGEFRWCDWTNWAAAQEAYVGYTRLWARPVWQQGLRVGIGQYISANKTNPVETAIIVAQSGLELMGWLRFVEAGRVPAKTWKNQRAYPADRKIRDLLGLANVDLRIPPSLAALQKLDPAWKDGPAVVAGVRNRLVHPRSKGGKVGWSGDVLADTWILISRYLELALLHAMGVKSGIRDRLEPNAWTGVIAKPPWA